MLLPENLDRGLYEKIVKNLDDISKDLFSKFYNISIKEPDKKSDSNTESDKNSNLDSNLKDEKYSLTLYGSKILEEINLLYLSLYSMSLSDKIKRLSDQNDKFFSLNEQAALEKRNLETQLSKYENLTKKCYADFDNYKKRALKDSHLFKSKIKEGFIQDILPVIDNIQMALSQDQSNVNVSSLYEGVSLISDQLTNLMNRNNLSVINCVGSVFNPEYHNAMKMVDTNDISKDGLIKEEYQKGYICDDKVLRHSKVVVYNYVFSKDFVLEKISNISKVIFEDTICSEVKDNVTIDMLKSYYSLKDEFYYLKEEIKNDELILEKIDSLIYMYLK